LSDLCGAEFSCFPKSKGGDLFERNKPGDGRLNPESGVEVLNLIPNQAFIEMAV
jgi:hypothetical protein